MKKRNIKFLRVASIIVLFLVLIVCGIQFYLYDICSNIFWLISAGGTFFGYIISTLHIKLDIKEHNEVKDKKDCCWTYFWLNIVNLVPILNFIICLLEVIFFIGDAIEIFSRHNNIEYDF